MKIDETRNRIYLFDGVCCFLSTLIITDPFEIVPAHRWFRHVGDPIWSVRDDSATALGAVCRAYGEEASEK